MRDNKGLRRVYIFFFLKTLNMIRFGSVASTAAQKNKNEKKHENRMLFVKLFAKKVLLFCVCVFCIDSLVCLPFVDKKKETNLCLCSHLKTNNRTVKKMVGHGWVSNLIFRTSSYKYLWLHEWLHAFYAFISQQTACNYFICLQLNRESLLRFIVLCVDRNIFSEHKYITKISYIYSNSNWRPFRQCNHLLKLIDGATKLVVSSAGHR